MNDRQRPSEIYTDRQLLLDFLADLKKEVVGKIDGLSDRVSEVEIQLRLGALRMDTDKAAAAIAVAQVIKDAATKAAEQDRHMEAIDTAHTALKEKVEGGNKTGVHLLLSGGGILGVIGTWVMKLFESTPTPPHH